MTAIGRAPAFERPEMRDQLARALCGDHLVHSVVLHAFAVMPTYVHVICTTPPESDVSTFVQQLRATSTRVIVPLMTAAELSRLGVPSKSGVMLWRKTSRCFPVSEVSFAQKMRYVPACPVREGICAESEESRWSTAALHQSAEEVPAGGWAVAWLQMAGLHR
jgi:REP element-mobilizing transposase RayT